MSLTGQNVLSGVNGLFIIDSHQLGSEVGMIELNHQHGEQRPHQDQKLALNLKLIYYISMKV